MKKRFSIFWFGESGPTWIDAVDTLETAKDHIESLPHNNSGSYAVLDQRTGNRLSFASKLQASVNRTQQNLTS
jgi:hypothetical protein